MKAIKNFHQTLKTVSRTIQGEEAYYNWILKAMRAQRLSSNMLSSVPQLLRPSLYTFIGNDNYNLLMHALSIDKTFANMIIEEVNLLSEKLRKEIYTQRSHLKRFNALDIAIRSQASMVDVILQNLTTTFCSDALLHFSNEGITTLMGAVMHKYKSIDSLLSKIPNNLYDFIYQQKSSYDNNIIMLASIFNPLAIPTLLHRMPVNMTHSVFEHNNCLSNDALSLAIKYHPDLIVVFFPYIKKIKNKFTIQNNYPEVKSLTICSFKSISIISIQ